MRKRNLYVVDDTVTFKRSVARGAGIHVYYNGEHIGMVERHRTLTRKGEYVTIWLAIGSLWDVTGPPSAQLRVSVERLVRNYEIVMKGHTTWSCH